MKILHICMTQYSNGWTYQENMLAKYHVKLGHQVRVITSMFCYKEGKLTRDTQREFIDCNGVSVVRLEIKMKGLFGKTPRYKLFYESIRDFDPDIIFSHGCQYIDILEVVRFAKEHEKVRVFVDNHADFSNSARNWLSRIVLHKIIWKKMANAILPYTEKFYGVLPARVDFLVTVYNIPRNKCELLVMGGDDELIENARKEETRQLIRKRYGIAEEDKLIVTGGKIDGSKTQTILLMKAVRNISIPTIKLIVFGSVIESLKPQIDRLVDGKKIQYIGWLNGNDTYHIFAAADLVVFPGRHSVFWEQVAGQGIPMICKKWSGTQHVDVGGNVVFLEKESVDEIQKSIIRIMTDYTVYNEMKMCAVDKAMKCFSYKSIAEKSIMDE